MKQGFKIAVIFNKGITERKDMDGRIKVKTILKGSGLIPKDCFVFIVHSTKKCLLNVYSMTGMGVSPVRDTKPR